MAGQLQAVAAVTAAEVQQESARRERDMTSDESHRLKGLGAIPVSIEFQVERIEGLFVPGNHLLEGRDSATTVTSLGRLLHVRRVNHLELPESKTPGKRDAF